MKITKKIGTHSGSFHADEGKLWFLTKTVFEPGLALACGLLRLLPEYADCEIVRTRDPEVWKEMSILVDVGAEYVPEKNRYSNAGQKYLTLLFPGSITIKRDS